MLANAVSGRVWLYAKDIHQKMYHHSVDWRDILPEGSEAGIVEQMSGLEQLKLLHL